MFFYGFRAKGVYCCSCQCCVASSGVAALVGCIVVRGVLLPRFLGFLVRGSIGDASRASLVIPIVVGFFVSLSLLGFVVVVSVASGVMDRSSILGVFAPCARFWVECLEYECCAVTTGVLLVLGLFLGFGGGVCVSAGSYG